MTQNQTNASVDSKKTSCNNIVRFNSDEDEMIIKKFIKKLSFLNFSKYERKKSIPLLNPSKDEIERLTLKEVDSLISEKKYKKALKLITTSIKSGAKTNKILLKKAFLLSQIGQYTDAHAIWERLSNLTNKPKIAALAKKSLEMSKHLQANQINSVKLLIETCHAIAQKYQQKLNHLPSSKDEYSGENIIPAIRREAEIARTYELPKLSSDIIEQTLQAGLESPLLINDKALSMGMLGQHKKALEILTSLEQEIKNPSIKNTIKESITNLEKSANHHQAKKSIYLIKQSKLLAISSGIEAKHIPDEFNANTELEVKSLIFGVAINCIKTNPKACLRIVNSILDYFPDDGASMQLKGEALAELKRDKEAINVWTKLAHSEHEETADKARKSISQLLAQKALLISANKSPQEALSIFIDEHLKINLAPTFNELIAPILNQFGPGDETLFDPELEHHQLQLQFNTIVIQRLEAQLINQSNSKNHSPAEKPDAISKTASKAG
ncbi:tetratricopeptide repeat protein [Synechococcus sp. CC9605]|uniref:tetratricopeptide repeat protein n=1 Tax=Synechococcus sp. (strain CC9605) TaxID=110662 RepID=UPI0002F17565|nr:hypothetical protein [Synechococcus sp. CC9605]